MQTIPVRGVSSNVGTNKVLPVWNESIESVDGDLLLERVFTRRPSAINGQDSPCEEERGSVVPGHDNSGNNRRVCSSSTEEEIQDSQVVHGDGPETLQETTISVDPGIGGTGWAVWKDQEKVPTNAGIVKGRKDTSWQNQCETIVNQLEAVLLKYRTCSRIVCEFPQDMSSSPVGYAAAKRGDIIKLSYLIGSMARAADLGDGGFVLVPVREWKGQLPKTVVKKRILVELGWQREVPEYMTPFDKKSMDHDWDAVGIGLYYFGRF